jgi:hypothetical protein
MFLHFQSNRLTELSSQAILGQFSRKCKATNDGKEDAEDEGLLKEIDEPEDEADIEACEGEDEDREASDEIVLMDVDKELEEDEVDEHKIPELTRDEVNLGRFSILKVQLSSVC